MPGKPDNVLGSTDVMPSLPGSGEEEARGVRSGPGVAITVRGHTFQNMNESLGLVSSTRIVSRSSPELRVIIRVSPSGPMRR